METSGVIPHVKVHVDDLATVATAPGPFVTVEMATPAERENAAQFAETAWKSLRTQLEDQGAPSGALDVIEPVVPDAHLEGDGLIVVASAGRVHQVMHAADAPPRDAGRVAPLPTLTGVINARQATPTCVIVTTDRGGADLTVVASGVPVEGTEAGGHDDPIAKSQPGGWSQKRYQHRAEQTWEHNADDVARTLLELVDRHAPRLIVVAGDVRAVQLLRDSLPERVLELVEEIDGSRSADGSADVMGEAFRRMVSTAVARDTVAILAKWREEHGQSDLAADGPAATIEALRQSQVEVLLVPHDFDDDRQVWLGPDPVHVAVDRDELVQLGVDQPFQARLVDGLVRAALATGAWVRIVPTASTLSDGVGALLRWR